MSRDLRFRPSGNCSLPTELKRREFGAWNEVVDSANVAID
jgi:hypothetical protein